MVIDTSVFIEYLRSKNKNKATLLSIEPDTQIYTSSVTLYELLMGATTKEKQQHIMQLLGGIDILPFDKEASITASKIYNRLKRQNQLIEFRDIFIASICVNHSMPILTLNKKHFNRIEELDIA